LIAFLSVVALGCAVLCSSTSAGSIGKRLFARIADSVRGPAKPKPVSMKKSLEDTRFLPSSRLGVRQPLSLHLGTNIFDADVQTNKSDYYPGETVIITGSGWQPGENVTLTIVESDNDAPWHSQVTADNSGNIYSATFVILTHDIGVSFTLTATGSSSSQTALTTFTDGNASANLNQFANKSGDPADWVNGNLGASKSIYFEGDSIPYRLLLDNLSPGSPHTVTIEWDTTKSSKHSIDYLTTFDRSAANADPCAGVSGCDKTIFAAFPIPLDPQVTAAGVTPITGEFRLFGGTITAVSAYSYANGSGFTNDKSARISITFAASAVNPVLAWSGHIATRKDWTSINSAVAITGSPYHTRLIDLDGSGGNQDRSLSADAVTFPGSITIIKNAISFDGNSTSQNFNFTTTGGLSPSSFTLDSTNTLPGNTQSFPNITTFQNYSVTEPAVTGWPLTGIVCTVDSANGGSQSQSGNTETINLKEGEDVTCTFTNTEDAEKTRGKLIVIKHVINDNGGNAIASNWTMDVTGTPTSHNAGVESPGTPHFLKPDTAYSVSESGGPTGYSATYSTDCTSTTGIPAGETRTCTVTNDDNAPSLTLDKITNYTHGGTAPESTWTLTADGGTAGTLFGPGASGSTDVVSGVSFKAGTYTLSESAAPAGYTNGTAYSCVKNGGAPVSGNSITLAVGDTAVCSITNTDLPGKIVVQKIIKPLGALTNFSFNTTGMGYLSFFLAGGQSNSQTLNAGSYSVKELVPLGWVLSGIGGSTNTNTPYNCTVTGSGGSTGVGDLNTQTAAIALKPGDTVTCVFENTGSGMGVTRTQGFWATHTPLANIAWFGGTAFGHTFPGVAGTSIGDKNLCSRQLDTLGKVMGAFWSNISTTSTGAKRSALDQARMQLLQQLIAAELNASAFGSVPSVGSFAAWESAYCGTNQNAIKTAATQAASFNNNGDSSTFTPGTSADSKNARAIANYAFWDVLP